MNDKYFLPDYIEVVRELGEEIAIVRDSRGSGADRYYALNLTTLVDSESTQNWPMFDQAVGRKTWLDAVKECERDGL